MGNPYTTVTVTNYNSNPPADDGSEVTANQLQWSKHTTKIGDPLKTAIESINTNVNAAVGKLFGGAGITSTATDHTVTTSDQGKLIKVTASATITTPDATSVGSPFVFSVVNEHTSSITLAGSGSQTIDGSDTITIAPKGGVTLNTDGTNWFTHGQNFTLPYPPGHIYGLTLSNAADATNDIEFDAGKCRDSSDAQNLVLASALIKQLDASWAAGTNAGGRSSAGLADGTWHCFVIGKTDGTTDALFHSAVDPSAVLPSGYTLYRRVGSIIRASSTIVAFSQFDDEFLLNAVSGEYSDTGPSAGATTKTLAFVPTGIKVWALHSLTIHDPSPSSFTYGCITSPDQANVTPTSTKHDFFAGSSAGLETMATTFGRGIRTNTSAQIKYHLSASPPVDMIITGTTRGWIDARGRGG